MKCSIALAWLICAASLDSPPAALSTQGEPAQVAARQGGIKAEKEEPPRFKAGPSSDTERAMRAGLSWLARHQNPGGSWSPAGLAWLCSGGSKCAPMGVQYTDHYDVGVTGLALLCFLTAGYDEQSTGELLDEPTQAKYKPAEVIGKGLAWLLKEQSSDGHFTSQRPFLYNEAIAALAVIKAWQVEQKPELKRAAQAAVAFLVAAQKPNPNGPGLWGWRYASRPDVEIRKGVLKPEAYRTELYDADTSVTSWVIMALGNARLAGLRVPDESFAGGMSFSDSVTQPDGMVGYLKREEAGMKVTGTNDHYTYHPACMSALGMMSRVFARGDPDDAFYARAVAEILTDLPVVSEDNLSIDYYYWHQASLALWQYGGPEGSGKRRTYWNAWNQSLCQALLSLQTRDTASCREGGWLVPDRWSYTAGPLYATALNTLTLLVYYRYDEMLKAKRPEER